MRWFIKLDIDKYFETLSHELIIKLISQKIDDPAFISLVYKLLRCGYNDKGTLYRPRVGVSQDVLISPILSNIVISLLDEYIEVLEESYNIGEYQRLNPDYRKLSKAINSTKKLSEHKKMRAPILRHEIRAHISKDEKYKRMKFIRYGNHILIGVIGSKQDCKDLCSKVSQYLNTELGMSFTQDKTCIYNATSDKVRYLDYDFSITPYKKRPIIKKST